jgi:hydrogenase/urease accessory protein HupE
MQPRDHEGTKNPHDKDHVFFVRASRLRVFVVALVFSTASIAQAHEMGKTQVIATISERAYTIDIVVDPDALLTTLEAFGGAPISTATLGRSERDRRIVALAPVMLDRVALRFDGRADRPAFAYVAASALGDAAQSPSTVRLTGERPAGADEMTFANGLALGWYALNVRIGDSALQTFWLEGTQASAPISLVAPPPPPTRTEVARQYFGLGFTHILPKGLDHILFVVGIFLLSARWKSILLQVSTFTVAHSITLGLTMYGIVSLPAKVVEPMIALSIAYVAIENLVTSDLKPWRLALVFSFGLLHGMGFAGVLRDLGLPHSQFLTALLTFNAGVEAGQLTVIAISFAVVAHWRSSGASYRRLVVQPGSLVIALVGLYWVVERVL